jgi:hypothetical protein
MPDRPHGGDDGAGHGVLIAPQAASDETLPETLANSATTEALQAIVELDLEALADIVPPRGYGRD